MYGAQRAAWDEAEDLYSSRGSLKLSTLPMIWEQRL